MADPLAGKRNLIRDRKISVLIWPAVVDGSPVPCPVVKGQAFECQGFSIVIESATRKMPKGRESEWHAQFVRLDTDKPQLLRRVPSGMPQRSDESADMSDIEKARRESAYTSSAGQALDREPESVGPDWKDPGVAERVKRLHESRREMEDERLSKNAKSQLGRVLKGLDPDQRLQLLAYIEKGCELAQSGELKDVA